MLTIRVHLLLILVVVTALGAAVHAEDRYTDFTHSVCNATTHRCYTEVYATTQFVEDESEWVTFDAYNGSLLGKLVDSVIPDDQFNLTIVSMNRTSLNITLTLLNRSLENQSIPFNYTRRGGSSFRVLIPMTGETRNIVIDLASQGLDVRTLMLKFGFNSSIITINSNGGLIADAYVNRTAPTTNYGTANTLRTGNASTEAGYMRFYQQYNLSSFLIPGTIIQNAQLCTYENDAITGTKLYRVAWVNTSAMNNWSETGINWNNQPCGNAIGNPSISSNCRFEGNILSVGTTNQYYCYNVTPHVVNAWRNASTNITFMWYNESQTAGAAFGYRIWNSREAASGKPLLNVTWSSWINWSSNSTSTPYAGSEVNHSVNFSSLGGLDMYQFWHYNGSNTSQIQRPASIVCGPGNCENASWAYDGDYNDTTTTFIINENSLVNVTYLNRNMSEGKISYRLGQSSAGGVAPQIFNFSSKTFTSAFCSPTHSDTGGFFTCNVSYAGWTINETGHAILRFQVIAGSYYNVTDTYMVSTTGWRRDNWVKFGATGWANVSKNLSSSPGVNYSWYVRANNTAQESQATAVFNYTSLDRSPPQWSTNSTNSTCAGSEIQHRVNFSDAGGLDGFVFFLANGTERNYKRPYAFENSTTDPLNVSDNGWNDTTTSTNLTAMNYLIVNYSFTDQYPENIYWTIVGGYEGTFGEKVEVWDFTAFGIGWWFQVQDGENKGQHSWSNFNSSFMQNRTARIRFYGSLGGGYMDVSDTYAVYSNYTNNSFMKFGTTGWANVSKNVSSVIGTNYSWFVWANDTSGNNVTTPVFDYTTTDCAGGGPGGPLCDWDNAVGKNITCNCSSNNVSVGLNIAVDQINFTGTGTIRIDNGNISYSRFSNGLPGTCRLHLVTTRTSHFFRRGG